MYTVPGIYQDYAYSPLGLLYMEKKDHEWIRYIALRNKETGRCALYSVRMENAELLQAGKLKDLAIQYPEYFI